MTSFQSSPHNLNIAGAVKRIVASAISHLDQLVLDCLFAELGWVHKVGSPKLLAPFLLFVIDINDNDLASAVLDRTLDDGQTNTARAEDGHIGALLDLGCDDCSAIASGDAATEQTCAVHGSIWGDRYDGDIGNYGVLGEGGGAHEVQQILTFALEAGGAVWHHTLALGGSNLAAEIGLARFAEFAFLAFWCAGKGQQEQKRVGLSQLTREQQHDRQA
jgi:hypothetical protein